MSPSHPDKRDECVRVKEKILLVLCIKYPPGHKLAGSYKTENIVFLENKPVNIKGKAVAIQE